MMMKKHILIIGGMGPQASVHAHKRVIDIAHEQGAQDNNEYPRITHLSINVPDFISQHERKADALREIEQAISELDTGTVTGCFIACNTAHMLFENVAHMIGSHKMISLIDLTKDYVCTLDIPKEKVALLATPSTVAANLYDAGMIPDTDQQQIVEDAIRDLISNQRPEDVYRNLLPIMQDYKEKGAEAIIMGCTELSMLSSFMTTYPIVDPIDLAVAAVME